MSQRVGLAVAFLVGGLASSAFAGRIGIDLRQADVEAGSNVANDTWRWGSGDPHLFDLEFSSGNGSHIDLDGGSAQGNEYYSGLEVATNHTYDYLWATYLGGNSWRIDAVRGLTTTILGTVTEYSDTLSHAANYSYSGEESHVIQGPDDAGANAGMSASQWKAWFWIYRNTTDDTISINIASGSGAVGFGGDGGSFNAEFLFDGAFLGAPTEHQGNEPGEITVDGGNPNLFIGRWDWDEGHDDGASLGGLGTVAEIGIGGAAVPLPPAVWSGLALLAALGIGGRLRRRSPTLD